MDQPSTSPRVHRRGSTLRPPGRPRGASSAGQLVEAHERALKSVRNFLRNHTSYDVFPVSFRIIVLDNKLEIKKALHVLLANSVISAPLWNGDTARFAGMFTVQDIIHLIQYYYLHSSYEEVTGDVEQFRLESLRDIERELNVPTPPLISISPLKPLWEACELLIRTHARRLPLLDIQPTGEEVILSVLTQYRALKAISTNVKDIRHLKRSLQSLGIGTYVKGQADDPFYPIQTARMNTTVFDVVHLFSEQGISAVPIIDDDGIVVNLYETVDVITLVRLGVYQNLDLTISSALKQRPHDFPGVITCTPGDSLASLLLLIQQRRVHRLVVVEGAGSADPSHASGGTTPTATGGATIPPPTGRKGRLVGIITLSDILRYLIGADEVPRTGAQLMSSRAGGSISGSGSAGSLGASAGGSGSGMMPEVPES